MRFVLSKFTPGALIDEAKSSIESLTSGRDASRSNLPGAPGQTIVISPYEGVSLALIRRKHPIALAIWQLSL